MVFVQVSLTATNQLVDLGLPPGSYKVRWIGVQVAYSTAHTNFFQLQFQSQLTRQRYGNCAQGITVQAPPEHSWQVDGEKCWQAELYGAVQFDVVDLSTGIAPIGARFTSAMLYFDVEQIVRPA